MTKAVKPNSAYATSTRQRLGMGQWDSFTDRPRAPHLTASPPRCRAGNRWAKLAKPEAFKPERSSTSSTVKNTIHMRELNYIFISSTWSIIKL